MTPFLQDMLDRQRAEVMREKTGPKAEKAKAKVTREHAKEVFVEKTKKEAADFQTAEGTKKKTALAKLKEEKTKADSVVTIATEKSKKEKTEGLKKIEVQVKNETEAGKAIVEAAKKATANVTSVNKKGEDELKKEKSKAVEQHKVDQKKAADTVAKAKAEKKAATGPDGGAAEGKEVPYKKAEKDAKASQEKKSKLDMKQADEISDLNSKIERQSKEAATKLEVAATEKKNADERSKAELDLVKVRKTKRTADVNKAETKAKEVAKKRGMEATAKVEIGQ